MNLKLEKLSRNDLIFFVINNLPKGSGTISHNMVYGRVEVEGQFKRIPPTPYPGWVVKVTGRRGLKTDYLGVINKGFGEYQVIRLLEEHIHGIIKIQDSNRTE